MCVHRTYNSDSAKEFMKLVAPYYNAIETTKVTFENENVIVYADSLGSWGWSIAGSLRGSSLQ